MTLQRVFKHCRAPKQRRCFFSACVPADKFDILKIKADWEKKWGDDKKWGRKLSTKGE
jgi:hypothetical protein